MSKPSDLHMQDNRPSKKRPRKRKSSHDQQLDDPGLRFMAIARAGINGLGTIVSFNQPPLDHSRAAND